MRMTRLTLSIIFCLFALCTFFFTGAKIIGAMVNYRIAEKEYQQLQMSFEIEIPERATSKMQALNPDYLVWIRIEGTEVNYPVVRESETVDYLCQGFTGEDNVCGTLFVRLGQAPFQDANTVIFGHNMKDGSMFASLKKYLDRDYYQKHSIIEIHNKEEIEFFKIFAVQLLEEADREAFTYRFESQEKQKQYLEQMICNSKIATTEKPEVDDKIITLSTCYGKTQRLIVQAYREEESDGG